MSNADIHRSPAAVGAFDKSEIFETGIKAIDVLVPMERGVRLIVRWRGVGKTVLLTEMIHNMIGHQQGMSIFCESASVAEKAKNSIAE